MAADRNREGLPDVRRSTTRPRATPARHLRDQPEGCCVNSEVNFYKHGPQHRRAHAEVQGQRLHGEEGERGLPVQVEDEGDKTLVDPGAKMVGKGPRGPAVAAPAPRHPRAGGVRAALAPRSPHALHSVRGASSSSRRRGRTVAPLLQSLAPATRPPCRTGAPRLPAVERRRPPERFTRRSGSGAKPSCGISRTRSRKRACTPAWAAAVAAAAAVPHHVEGLRERGSRGRRGRGPRRLPPRSPRGCR